MSTITVSEFITEETSWHNRAALPLAEINETADVSEVDTRVLALCVDGRVQATAPGEAPHSSRVMRLVPRRRLVPLTEWVVTCWSPQIK